MPFSIANMPAERKRKRSNQAQQAVPFQLPEENRATLVTRIINRTRILDSITLPVGRKLIKAALKTNRLKIQIGMEPCCRCVCLEVDV